MYSKSVYLPQRKTNDNVAPPSNNPDRRLAQPFSGWTHERMNQSAEDFIKHAKLEDYADYIRRGAFLAQSRAAFPLREKRGDGLSLKDEERHYLELEISRRHLDKFKQPWRLYALVVLCSLGAAVQGWDESAVNAAQVQYREPFGLSDSGWWLGLINSAPSLCAAFACWLNYPLNKLLDRRGVIFLTCLISSVSCFGQAFPKTWRQLFVARFVLGLGIGPKSATIPIYVSECAPTNIRGALVMMWQMWTAFGIMCGYISGVALSKVGSPTYSSHCNSPLALRCSLNWRLTLASPMVLPLVVVFYIYTLPESPRRLVMRAQEGNKKQYEAAFLALCKLRHTKLQAGRDLFLLDHLLREEEEIMTQQRPLRELFTVRRNRRALTASLILMFLQQFCGVNVTAYYSSTILKNNAHYTEDAALLLSMGFGIINFLFALPAVWTIDTFGRRNLLLATFPFMALFQLVIVLAFALPDDTHAQHGLIILGMYLFGIAYSPGEGPVPFVYSAESMPLYNRDYGMGVVTSINWFWNWFIAITWPAFNSAFSSSGAFGWYAGWCFIGWWLILLFVPETKDLTLEQLDQVFDFDFIDNVNHGLAELRWFVGKYVLGKRNDERPIFILQHDREEIVDTRGEDFAEYEESPGYGD